MTSDNLIIALEPEVASVWCKQLSVKDFFEEGSPGGKMEDVPGIQYILVDCGGGTIDITVHEILPDGYLKELHRATGGPWGGECVDENFRLLLKDIFQTDVWDRYEKEFPAEFHMMMYNFSLKKSSEKEEDVDIECLYNLTKLAEKKQDMPLFSKDKSDVTWLEGTIRITYKKFVSLFAESLGEIGGRIEALLSTPGFKINILLFVGGYASSKCLRKEMMRQFGSRCTVLFPRDPQIVIVKGAVLFGKNPKIIRSRVSALTYGIYESVVFDHMVHRPEKLRITKTGLYCADLFKKMVERDQSGDNNHVVEYKYLPIDIEQDTMEFLFYCTEALNPKYVDDPGVKKLGSFVVPMHKVSVEGYRIVIVNVKFGLTEIQVSATDLSSGETQKINLDFLTK